MPILGTSSDFPSGLVRREPPAAAIPSQTCPSRINCRDFREGRRRRIQLIVNSVVPALLLALASSTTRAGLVITPTYDASITSDLNAGTIENTIQNTINLYESDFTNNLTVSIEFGEMSSGLGQNNTYSGTVSYSAYRAALAANAVTTNAQMAVNSLPVQAGNPVNGNGNIVTTLPNLRALGFSGGGYLPPSGQTDSIVQFNESVMNNTRTSIDPNKYDLQTVISHEINEVLGLGSELDSVSSGSTSSNGPIAPEDLFRFNQSGARSYTTSSAAEAYFSINGGTTQLARFNQDSTGDFGDWYSPGGQTPQVQDAFGTPGATPALGAEITALNAIGYNPMLPNTVTTNGMPGTASSPNGAQAIATANAPGAANHTAQAFGGNAYGSGTGGYAHATATDGTSGSFSPSAGSYTVSLGGSAGNNASNTGALAVSTSNASNGTGKAIATGYAQGGAGSASAGTSNSAGAVNGGQGGRATSNATASASGSNGTYATAVALGGAGGEFTSIFTPPAHSGLGGSSQASSSATAAGSGTAQVYGISYGGSGGTFAGSNGNGVGGNGGSGSLGTVTASSNGGYVFVEGAQIGGAGGGFSHGGGTVTGGNGAGSGLTNAITGTTSGHSELIQITEGGAGGGGSGTGAAGAAGVGYSSLTSSITSGAVSDAGIEAYASGGTGGYFDTLGASSPGTASAGGAATSVANGTNNTGASGVAAYSIAGVGGLGVNGAASGAGGEASATATSSSTLAYAAVTAIGYAVGGNGGGSASTSSDAPGGIANAQATANLNGGYVNSYAQAVGGTPGNGNAGVHNSATALADAYANGAGSGAINAQASMTDTYNGQSASIQSNFPVTVSGVHLHTESYINAAQAPRAISAAAGANVATLLTQDPTNAEVTSLLATNPQAARNWNIGGANTSQPASNVEDYNQISFISAGTSSGTSQYHSSLTIVTNNVNLSTSHDAVISFLGGTSTGTGSVIIQVTNLENNNTLILNNGYGTLALADAATSNTTFDLGSIASLVSSSNTLSLRFDMYLFTTAASTSFQTGFIFGSSVLGSGPAGGSMLPMSSLRSSTTRSMAMAALPTAATPEPATLVLLALGTLGMLLKPRRKSAVAC